ncbi:alpha/beta hydrolase [Oceanobacillus sp. FSL K6-3682]|uniref:alpha/beta hydrolase n=1 Tax=Oceanobacillus sp. FSL K6-3682 TaxID=2921503 RepID=UPI0030DAEB0E
MKLSKKEIQFSNHMMYYTHIETGSNAICFMFSGSDYNYDKPLFYYATMAMLQNNIDIIHVHYAYGNDLLKKPLIEITEIMMEDIRPVISDVLKNNQYTETIFLGKSLGTIPIANNIMKNEESLTSKMILLTPLLKFDAIFDSILNSQHQGLLVIGDKDHHYNSIQISQLMKTNFKLDVVPNANHSLDVDTFDANHSIAALSKIIEKLQETICCK